MSHPHQPWPGHYPITVVALEALAQKLSTSTDAEPFRADKVLVVACAFWAAVAKETLDDYLGHDLIERLQSAHSACIEVGATAMAAVVQDYLENRARNADELGDRRSLTDLQTDLALAGHEMDGLIATYAANRIRDGILSP